MLARPVLEKLVGDLQHPLKEPQHGRTPRPPLTSPTRDHAVVASEDGLVMKAAGVDGDLEDTQAALAAAISIGERLLEQGQLGSRADRVMLTLDDDQAAVERIGEHHLVVFAGQSQ